MAVPSAQRGPRVVVIAHMLLGAFAIRTATAAMDAGTALALLEQNQDSPCTSGPYVTKDDCLGKTSAKCMWLELDSKNLCLPCEFGDIPLPCAPIGSVFAMKKVKNCYMKCDHQQVVTKVSACTDVSGDISQSQCFAKGQSGLTKCMWTTYTTKTGADKSMCGPCQVEGVGKIQAYQWGNPGPEDGSTATLGVSMCDIGTTEFGMPCDNVLGIAAVTNCHPTPVPVLPPMGPVPLDAMRIPTTKDAPDYYAVPVMPPYGVKQYTEASNTAAAAAGWRTPGEPLPPDAPVVIWGPAPFEGPTLPPTLKVMYGPPPPGIPGVPPPGYGYGTVPPPDQVKAAEEQGEDALLQERRFLQRVRRLGPPAP